MQTPNSSSYIPSTLLSNPRLVKLIFWVSMPKVFTFAVALCLLLIGFDSGRVPGFTHLTWFIIYAVMALGVVDIAFRPTIVKFRLLTAMGVSAGLTRGLFYLLADGRFAAIAFHTLLALMSYGYYEGHKYRFIDTS